MAETTFNIKIKNSSGARHSYGVIMQPPQITSQEDVVVSPCVLRVTEPVEPGSTTNISISMPTIAIIGSSAEPFSDRKQILIKQERPLIESPDLAINVDAKLGTPYFTVPAQPTGNGKNKKTGEYSFKTASYDFQKEANIWSGVGSSLSNGEVIPAYIWLIQPSQTYTFSKKPPPTFLVFRGARDIGTIVDISTITAPAILDFTGKSYFSGRLEDTNRGAFNSQIVSPVSNFVPSHKTDD